ncbi:conserved hypothetical protein [Pseudomonas sp. IT-347P]
MPGVMTLTLIPALPKHRTAQRERGPTEVSCELHRPERLYRLWIHSRTFKSAYPLNIPHSVPSPSGRGLG